ncbi:unnamed protein product [Spirodela intermedia]|uniref:Uncharacterized protein n=1 Tax=Spirodela intermedia TaxID=51605 RepID=A0A7I8KFK6_SPIIN|nr:unnamed protein product [Spirodela intermedia]
MTRRPAHAPPVNGHTFDWEWQKNYGHSSLSVFVPPLYY